MSTSDYVKRLRERVGHDLVLLPGVAAIVRDERGHVLVQRRSDDGQWSLPAGAVDPGESPSRAVVREVHEETGLRVRPARVTGVFGGAPRHRHRYPNGDEAEYVVVLFECETVGGTLRPVDGESARLEYVPPEVACERVGHYPLAVFRSRPGGEALFD